MWMSRNTASTPSRVQLAQRQGGVGRGAHPADGRMPLQQVGELVERGGLVVDGEHGHRFAHADRTSARRALPDRNFGTRITTLVPAPSAVSTTRP